jgi:hypothetical protein
VIRRLRVVLAVCFVLSVGVSLSAPRPKPKQPLPPTFSITVDRESYLPHEPIWVDWVVTNQGDDSLYVSQRDAVNFIRFTYMDAKEKAGFIEKRSFGCYTVMPPPFIVLDSGKSMRGWFNFRDLYVNLPNSGTLAFQGTARLCYSREAPQYPNFDGVLIGDSPSNTVKLEISKPAGADKDTVSFIIKENRGNPDDIDGSVRTEAGAWGRIPRQARKVIETTKSERFRAHASFYIGLKALEGTNTREAARVVSDEDVRTAIQSFRSCKDSPESSRYLRGLATLQLARAYSYAVPAGNRKKAKELAEMLPGEYPNTAIAFQADELLTQLKKGE